MIYTMYSGFLVFSIILLMALVFTRISFHLKVLIGALAMGTWAITALNSHNVTDVYVEDGIMFHVVVFESWDAISMSMFCILGFSIVLILFVVNVLLSLADYRTPIWRRRIEEHNKRLSDD